MRPAQAGVAAAVATTSRQMGLTLGVAALGYLTTTNLCTAERLSATSEAVAGVSGR
jgi:hypothetical protein